MKKKTFKNKIRKGELLIGGWLTLGHSSIAELISISGVDWITIDLEHSSINIKEAEDLIRIIDLKNVIPLVRTTSHDPDQIKRVLDSGATGVIVPMINSIEDLNSIIESVYYPPIGKRSVGLARAQGYGKSFREYLNSQLSETIIIAQIEHYQAVEKIDSIFESKHLDGYIIGPYDLSSSMGIPGDFKNKKFLSAIEKIKASAKKNNINGGIHIIEPNIKDLKKNIKEGFRFIPYSLDIRVLETVYSEVVETVKKGLN